MKTRSGQCHPDRVSGVKPAAAVPVDFSTQRRYDAKSAERSSPAQAGDKVICPDCPALVLFAESSRLCVFAFQK
ncbi:MAG TPA: hypothetical protein VFP12_16025 [Allosphingosinicella sp.]|nr:hypothetical protein [Allosphingosinicella sp.]